MPCPFAVVKKRYLMNCHLEFCLGMLDLLSIVGNRGEVVKT